MTAGMLASAVANRVPEGALVSGEPRLSRGDRYKAAFASGKSSKFWCMLIEKAYVPYNCCE